MPIFEYQCDNCGHRLDKDRKASDPHPKKCPGCKKFKLQRVWGRIGIVFKGGGWPGEEIKKGGSGA
jgi:putative FmdB family regulatory protein